MDSKIVIGLGEVLFDCLPEGKKLGGAPANFAYNAAQFGMDAYVVSAIGKDEAGEEVLRDFDRVHLNYKLPKVDYPTGMVHVELDAEGVAQYDIKLDAAWDHIPYSHDLETLAKKTKAVSFGSLAQRSEESRTTINNFLDAMSDKDTLKIFDINLRQSFYTPEIIQNSLRRCNVLKINDEELVTIARLFGYPGINLQDKCWLLMGKYNLKMLILTCGINGSYVFAEGVMSFLPTPKVEVADTVGAGDSFSGAFCASLLQGKTIRQAHEKAVKVSAYVCTQNGAMPFLPKELIEG